MKLKLSILYSWLVRTLTFFWPNIPFLMRFRGFLYSLMMKECGKDFQVTSSAILNSLSGLIIKNNVYIGPNTVIIGVDICIEDDVLIGPNCVISGGNHSFLNGSFRFGPSISAPVLIKKGSWIAANCTITAGAIMPPSSILAAGGVLSQKFIEGNALYGGIPAKFIKTINI